MMTEGTPVERSEAFDRKLDQIGGAEAVIAGLTHWARTAAMAAWIAIGGLLVAIAALAIGLYVNHQTARTAAVSAVNRSQVYLTCISGNRARETERNLWDFILSQPPSGQPLTVAQQAEITTFKNYLNTNLADRNCQQP